MSGGGLAQLRIARLPRAARRRLPSIAIRVVAHCWLPAGGPGVISVSLKRLLGGEDEHLADHVRVLLVAAHEADHVATRGVLDDRLEALTHHVLEGHPLVDHGRSASAIQKRLLDRGEAAAQHPDDDVDVVLGLGWTWRLLRRGSGSAGVLAESASHRATPAICG